MSSRISFEDCMYCSLYNLKRSILLLSAFISVTFHVISRTQCIDKQFSENKMVSMFELLISMHLFRIDFSFILKECYPTAIETIKRRRFMEKNPLLPKYPKHVHETNDTVFTTLPIVKWAKFHVSCIIIDKISSFVHVISSATDLHSLHCESAGEKIS